VVKANHGSGALVICWDGAPKANVLPRNLRHVKWDKFVIHPDNLDWNHLQSLTRKWMSLNFYWTTGKYPEWAYLNIKPQILVEKIVTTSGRLPSDYKFFMIGGECAFIQLDVDRFTGHKRDFYDVNWKKLNASCVVPNSEIVAPPPQHLSEMLNLASKISEGIDFIRVDLYESENGIKFGELTNYPGGGYEKFKPKSFSVSISQRWNPNHNY
jgi:hypothetical protein